MQLTRSLVAMPNRLALPARPRLSARLQRPLMSFTTRAQQVGPPYYAVRLRLARRAPRPPGAPWARGGRPTPRPAHPSAGP